MQLKQKGHLNRGCTIQNEISRDNWEQSVSSAQASDLRGEIKYLAKADGKKAMSYRPACLDPSKDWEKDSWRFTAEGKGNLLGAFFAERLRKLQRAKYLVNGELSNTC